jgi:biopolymer transport protein ExbB
MPHFLAQGGLMIWLIVASSAVALSVFVERLLQYHRDQINSAEFLNGVRNVLKRDNIVEAVAICDATPGPVPRLVKIAILNRERGREAVREMLADAGSWEVRRLEEKLNLLATIAQIAPLLGLLGTVLGFMQVFRAVQDDGLNTHIRVLSSGVWQAMICTAAGLSVSIPSYAGYNYLVGRVNTIVLDMEQVSSEVLNIVFAAPVESAAAPA